MCTERPEDEGVELTGGEELGGMAPVAEVGDEVEGVVVPVVAGETLPVPVLDVLEELAEPTLTCTRADFATEVYC